MSNVEVLSNTGPAPLVRAALGIRTPQFALRNSQFGHSQFAIRHSRKGGTLVEVLVAIFIMAIGLLALLTLFPLGALTMARSLTDDRVSTAASEAAAMARTWQLQNDPNVAPAFQGGLGFPKLPSAGAGATVPIVPGYPVFVDPSGSASSITLGAVPAFSPGIPRVSPSYVSAGVPSLQIAKWFTLADDLTYTKVDAPTSWLGYTVPQPKGGVAVIGNPGNLQREGRYSWSYMLRAPNCLATNVAEMTVIVYANRPAGLLTGERTYAPVIFNHGATSVDVTWGAGQEKPPVRAGSWVLDATVVNGLNPEPYGFFYRVVAVSDTGPNSVNIELQTPIKPSYPAQAAAGHNGVLMVLENVAEVIDKGQVGVKEY
jgi:hypothetical protein